MKYLLVLLCFITFSYSGQLECGGHVPLINQSSDIGVVSIDFSNNGNNVKIADFTISNNTQSFIVILYFNNKGSFCKDSFCFTPDQLILKSTGIGVLGKGISTPISKNIYLNSNNEYIWIPGKQSSATINYQFEILASWKAKSLMPGLYLEFVTVKIQAIDYDN